MPKPNFSGKHAIILKTILAAALGSVTVAGVSASADVVARVSVVGNTLKLDAVSVSLPAGVSVPAAVLADIRSRAGFSISVPGLPRGLRLTGLTVGPGGVTVTIRADNIVLSSS